MKIAIIILCILIITVCAYAASRKKIIKGKASWYGNAYAGMKMADGHLFDPHAMTCASSSFPLGTKLLVRKVGHHHAITVTVTDRGPHRRTGRILDLSYAAFYRMANGNMGIADVEVEMVP